MLLFFSLQLQKIFEFKYNYIHLYSYSYTIALIKKNVSGFKCNLKFLNGQFSSKAFSS